MKYFTYIILCGNNKYYVGHTADLQKRFDRHKNKTGARFTLQNKPMRILWSKEFKTEIESVKREKQIKGWSRIKKEKLINGIWE
jgi:putative endonuclease